MTTPLDTAAEALKGIPGLKMKSLEQRREIVRTVLRAHWQATGAVKFSDQRSIADLGADGNGPLPVYKGVIR